MLFSCLESDPFLRNLENLDLLFFPLDSSTSISSTSAPTLSRVGMHICRSKTILLWCCDREADENPCIDMGSNNMNDAPRKSIDCTKDRTCSWGSLFIISKLWFIEYGRVISKKNKDSMGMYSLVFHVLHHHNEWMMDDAVLLGTSKFF